MKVIEKRIQENVTMEREELLSRKEEAKYRYELAKFGRRRGK